MPKKHELSGRLFGRLTVSRKDGVINGDRIAWLCLCDCGGETRTSATRLLSGATQSCGCLQKEVQADLTKHGKYGTKAYRVWQNMKTRCLNPKNKFFPLYGGRGIRVCEKWMEFEGFYDDMGNPPPGATLDRIDNDAGYSKSNCRWRSMKDQSNNRSTNIDITLNGKTQTLKQWAEQFGIKYTTAYWRHKKGWSPEAIFAA